MKKLISILALVAGSMALVQPATASTRAQEHKIESAPTQFLQTANTKFAYRIIGSGDGTPLVLLQHLAGTMDYWDPAVINGLAQGRKLVIFDNTGVGASSGKVPDNVEQMSADAASFIKALDYRQVDLLGFSLGGMIAQKLAAEHTHLVRKVILASTMHPGGGNNVINVLNKAMSQKKYPDPRMVLFFNDSERSLKAGQAFLERAGTRKVDRAPENAPEVAPAQAKAVIVFSSTPDAGNQLLNAITQPVLVVTGSNDTMLPSKGSYEMHQILKNAKLVIYPDSNHGAIFQYPQQFVMDANTFLRD